MKLVSSVILLMVLLLNAQSTKAQYYKATKGMLVRFDTAVVTEISAYRKETVKLKLGEQLIDSLTAYKETSKQEADLYQKQLEAKEFENKILNERIVNRDSTISFLTKQVSKRREEPLIKQPAFIIVTIVAIIGLIK